MAEKKPERPWLAPNEALKALVPLVEEYLAAAAQHYNACLFADEPEAVAANARAETAYSELVLALQDAKESIV